MNVYVMESRMLKKYIIFFVVILSGICSVRASDFYKPILRGDLPTVKQLLSKGSKLDAADIALAALKGHVELVEFLLHKGAPLDDEALRCAIRGYCENRRNSKAYEEIISMLLKAHAPFDKATLCKAVECGNVKIIKMLVDAMPNFSMGRNLLRLHSV